MRLGPIGEVSLDPVSGAGTASSGSGPTDREPPKEKSSGMSNCVSVLLVEGRPGWSTTDSTTSGTSAANGEATGADSTGGSCTVEESLVSTTACTATSAELRTALMATSTFCTSSLVEVPWHTVTRGGGGLLAVNPLSKYFWKLGDNTETGAIVTGELVAFNARSCKKDDSSSGGGPPWVLASM